MNDFLLAILTPISDFLWWVLPYLMIAIIALPLAMLVFSPLFFLLAFILGLLTEIYSTLIEWHQGREQNKSDKTMREIEGIKRLGKNPHYQ